MKAIITAGTGSHLRPLTHIKNKHLLELANKPLIFYAVEKVAEAGINDIGVVVREGNAEIQRVLGDGSRWDVNITYIPQVGGEKGIAHAVYCAQDFLGDDPFMVYLGDNIVNEDLKPLVDKFQKTDANCLLALAKVPRPERFGVPVLDKNQNIVRVEERPIKPKSDYAVAGLYFYDKNVHNAYPYIQPSFRGSYEISDLHTWLVQNGYNVEWHEIKHWWKDRGSASDLLEGNAMALDTIERKINGKIENSVRIEGNVKIGEGTKVGGRTVIRGPVVIGEHCLIKDSYIGPYTSVGNKVEMHGAHIEHSLVYEHAAITSKRKISDSIIGEHSIISNAEHETPKTTRVIVAENSSISI
ncbi:MAG: glucose-1-phosphate thymidylyltransferase [Candidatus Spechtbacterales bacterium]|nr:glucose-1-phosphate thymidylyltransferase [Candidatus Spechtbacterales bacterium]